MIIDFCGVDARDLLASMRAIFLANTFHFRESLIENGLGSSGATLVNPGEGSYHVIWSRGRAHMDPEPWRGLVSCHMEQGEGSYGP